MKNITYINELLSLKDERKKLVDAYKDTPPVEQRIKTGDFWPWVKEIEELLANDEEIPISKIQQIVHSNIESSALELSKLIHQELSNHKTHQLYMTRVHPNITEFAIGATLYLGVNVEIGITILDEQLVRTRKSNFKEKQTGFYIDASTTILACVDGSAKVGCWTSNEVLTEANIPQEFKGSYKESTLTKGKYFTIHAKKQGITFASVTKQAAMIIIKVIKNKSPIALQFDSKNFNLLAVVSSDHETSRFQVASVALRALDSAGDVDILKPYLKNKNSFIRWHTAREIYLRDENHGKAVFKELLNDINPMVRDSAQRCLNELYGD